MQMVARQQEAVETMKTDSHDAILLSTQSEKDTIRQFTTALKRTPIADDELLQNIGLFLTSKHLARILFFVEIYRKILGVHGIVAEFGVRWGQTLSLFSALRGIYEPFNRLRKIVGFDTFEGFKGYCEKDGSKSQCADGSFSVPREYEQYLFSILSFQEALNPAPHIRKFELVKGDARESVPKYLQDNPETIIALAVLDFDIYEPTKAVLRAIKPRLVKGSIVVFDELCDDYHPGETAALDEVFGLNNVRLHRMPTAARLSFMEIE